MSVEIFDGRDADHNDRAYQNWVQSHPDGYIINTSKGINADYMSLHRSRCDIVTNPDRYEPGAYTERQLVKICAETRSELVEWVKANGRPDGSFSTEQCPCNR